MPSAEAAEAGAEGAGSLSIDAASEEMAALRGVLASPRDCVKILTLDGRVSFMSEGGLGALNLRDLAEVRGASYAGLWEGDDALKAAAAIEAARAGGAGGFQAMLAPGVQSERRWWDVTITPILGPDGAPRSLLGISRDVTDLRQAEAAHARAQEYLQLALLAPSTVGVWHWDFASDTVRTNATLSRIYGEGPAVGEAGIPRGTLAARRHPEDAPLSLTDVFDRLAAGEEDLSNEYRIVEADGATRWFLTRGGPDRDADGRLVGLKGVSVEITDRRLLEERQALLLDELDHRVKNTLAMVEAIVSQSLREDRPIADIRATVLKRLRALSRAQDILTRVDWTGVDLAELVAEALAVNPRSDGEADGVEVEGPSLMLGPDAAVSFAIALQELAADAVRQGALSAPSGRLSIGWRLEDGKVGAQLRLTWREYGSTRATPPPKTGFDARLLSRAFTRLGGAARLEHDAAGLVFTVTAPLARLSPT